MSLENIIALLITLTAVFSYINVRFIKLPNTIGIMISALVFSLALVILSKFGFVNMSHHVESLMTNIDFNETLMHGMLSFLLFAGALHVNLNDLAQQKYVIGIMATLGVVISTFLIGTLTWYVLGFLNIPISYIYCLVFGALISPTDPIAVLGILKTAGAPKSLETKITGESLFNDGVGVVVFIVLLGIATGTDEVTASSIALLFVEETFGGIIYGLIIGYIAYYMIKSLDNYTTEILITLALVMGGYALANIIHVSGPIAIVVAGLLMGNHGRQLAMSDKTREHMDTFWELLDEILNAVLFVLIGLEVLLLTFYQNYLLAAAILIPFALLSRFIAVGLPVKILRNFREFSPNAIKIMTWGGLRGGISVALALSLPAGPEREVILSITYIIVIFSITVQGLTIGHLIKMGR
ncbi:MAG: sodium:proton antiporter [Gammaproteobacteria bacterium]|nr:sodium:proton antiporter [Gammaproteobacteria bacterium]